MTKFEPLEDNVLVEMKEAESKTAGGMILTTDAQKKANLALVRAVGPGRYSEGVGSRVPVNIKVGDLVLLPNSWVGSEVEIDGKDYKVVSSLDILGVLDSDYGEI